MPRYTGLGPFSVPSPPQSRIDPNVLAQIQAAPQVARIQRQANLYTQLANLPKDIFGAYQTVRGERRKQKIADIELEQLRSKSEMLPLEKEKTIQEIENIKAQAAERRADALFKSTQKPKQKFMLTNEGGRSTLLTIDPIYGLTNKQDLGPSSITSGKIQTAVQSFNVADKLLDQIEELGHKIITKGTKFPMNVSQGVITTIGGKVRSNPDAAAFTRIRKAFGTQLSRAAGETGVIATSDVERIIEALPDNFDTDESFANAISSARDLYENIKTGAVNTLSKPAGELLRQPSGKKIIPKKTRIEELGFK